MADGTVADGRGGAGGGPLPVLVSPGPGGGWPGTGGSLVHGAGQVLHGRGLEMCLASITVSEKKNRRMGR